MILLLFSPGPQDIFFSHTNFVLAPNHYLGPARAPYVLPQMTGWIATAWQSEAGRGREPRTRLKVDTNFFTHCGTAELAQELASHTVVIMQSCMISCTSLEFYTRVKKCHTTLVHCHWQCHSASCGPPLVWLRPPGRRDNIKFSHLFK